MARTMHAKTCARCGVAFESRYTKVRFCSRVCAGCGVPGAWVARFWSRVDRRDTNSCWHWMGRLNMHGYGRFTHDNKTTRAHRVAWELTYGPIPPGLHALHRCDVRRCCNPAHLFIGSPADNMTDKALKGRAPRGESHPMARLTEADVLEILSSKETIVFEARKRSMSPRLIAQIRSRDRWRHVSV